MLSELRYQKRKRALLLLFLPLNITGTCKKHTVNCIFWHHHYHFFHSLMGIIYFSPNVIDYFSNYSLLLVVVVYFLFFHTTLMEFFFVVNPERKSKEEIFFYSISISIIIVISVDFYSLYVWLVFVIPNSIVYRTRILIIGHQKYKVSERESLDRLLPCFFGRYRQTFIFDSFFLLVGWLVG